MSRTNAIPPLSLSDRARGALLGLACGDAVGTTIEFSPRGSFAPVTDMLGDGPFSLRPGQWTDDTSMALCLADSLIACQGFDARDQMNRYLNWWRWGYLSSTGDCFDIGITVRAALARFEATDEPFAGSTDTDALIQLADLALYRAKASGRNRALCITALQEHLDPLALARDIPAAQQAGQIEITVIAGPVPGAPVGSEA